MPQSSKIGVFDSGIGGLTVLSQLQAAHPGAEFIYLGDTARVPYGTKSESVIRRYALECAWFLNTHDVDTIVIACNSASAAGLNALMEVYPDLQILDVIGPGANAAASISSGGQIAVLGTRATIESGKYVDAILAHNPDAQVTQIACPLFVPLAEEGEGDSDAAHLLAQRYLEPLQDSACDTIVLGCKHYPLLKKTIQDVLGADVNIVDSASPLAALLNSADSGRQGAVRLYTTDSPERFIQAGQPFLGAPVPPTSKVDLEAMIVEEQKRHGGMEFLYQRDAA